MIIELPTPEARDELSLHRVGSWDEEQNPNNSTAKLQQQHTKSPICPHAVAFGSFVYGLRKNACHSGENHWLTWKTSFAPYTVCRVCSNHDGSIVVCSTDAGTVALLRGLDGSVLATRKVGQEEKDNSIAPARVSFIARCASVSDDRNIAQTERNNDAVAIEIPTGGHGESAGLILVSNIEANSLNQKNSIKVADASRKMSINSLLKIRQRNSNGTGSRDTEIVSLCGCFLGNTKIRFFVLDKVDTLAVHDYTTSSEDISVVDADFQWKKDMKTKAFCIDVGTGLLLHALNPAARYVMFGALESTTTTLQFVDPARLAMAGQCVIVADLSSEQKPVKLLSIEPLESALPDSALAFAVAFKHQKNLEGATIHVMQARINQEKLDSFHRVYAIAIVESVISLHLSSITSTDNGAYSFRYKYDHGSDNYACKAFIPGESYRDGSAIGRIRLLIKLERFDDADNLVNAVGENKLVADTYADFHPSEVALGRLQFILRRGSISEKSFMGQAKQCFHRLTSGCISGNERAGQNLLDACESIAQWGSPDLFVNPPSLFEVTAALSTVLKALEEVLKILPHERHQPFQEERSILESQLCTLSYLKNILPVDTHAKGDFLLRFQGSRNPGQLFSSLVAHGYFSAARDMWQSHLRSDIPSQVAVQSVIRIGANVDPAAYVLLLEDFILPSLAINYDLLPSLSVWACRIADELDQNNKLEQAIHLLQVSKSSLHDRLNTWR